MEEEASAEELRRFAEWVQAGHILLTPVFAEGGLSGKLQGKNAPPRTMLHSDWFRHRAETVKASGVEEHSHGVAYVKGWQQTVAATWSHVRDGLA